MEKIFQKLSLASASLVFIILLGIFFTLFNSSKLAIDEFGFDFITNPQWNEEVITDSPASAIVSDEILDEDDMILDEDDMIIQTPEFFIKS
ncbi:MAG: hypothetical protein H8E76_03930 [Helicobacteraceae bacterium]|nr:hypothetical protein [Candidatus Sulfurimonas ponti]